MHTQTPVSDEPTARCRNCDAPVTTPFCGFCGQSTDHGRLTVPDILSDIVEDQLSVNGSTVYSLRMLLRPGFLTQEYLRGRIVRYVAPFRLFLLATTIFVVAAAFTTHRLQPRIVAEAQKAIAAQQQRAARQARPGQPVKPFQLLQTPVDSLWLPGPLRGLVRPVLLKQARINALPLERSLPLVEGAWLRATSWLMPLLVPFVACLLALVYWRRRRLFAEHVVFTLHVHAFAFLVLALGMLTQLLWMPLTRVADVLFLAYFYVALVRVYGDGWLWTIPRFLLLLLLYLGLATLAAPFLQIALIALA